MCRMIAAPLGLSGDLLAAPFVRMATGMNTLSEFNRELGVYTHGHGWGAIVEGDREDELHRSVKACWEDDGITELGGKTVLLLHARKASHGAVSLNNVHPFEACVNGRQWSYCHNGTINQCLEIPASLQKADSTDSEQIFHQLLPYLEKSQVVEGFRAVYGGIRDFTSLNTFLLGPEALWVVCLHTTTPEYYTLYSIATEHGPIISSEPLLELGTQPIPLFNGQVLRINRGNGGIDEYVL